MNALTSPPDRQVVDAPIRLSDQRPPSIDIYDHRRKNLFRSLLRRWWYYAAITCIATAAAFFLGKKYQSTSFQAVTQLRARALPFPPGAAQIEQPRIGDFNHFLNHPDVLSEVAGPAFRIQTFDSPKLVDKELNVETKVLTLRLNRDTPLDAANTLNALVEAAIAKSTEERKAALDESLAYLQSIVGEAEAELARQRLAKATRLEELRGENDRDGKSSLEYGELTQLLQLRRTELLALESELTDGKRLMEILEKDESLLVQSVVNAIIEDQVLELQNSAKRFASDSEQASEFAKQIAGLEELGSRDIASREELLDIVHSMRQLVGPNISIPAEHDAALTRVADSRYTLANRLRLLPEKIVRSQELLDQTQEQRAKVEVSGGFNFESFPEIEDFTSRIERAQASANSVASAIAWTRDMRRLDAPAFEQIVVADIEDTTPDGDFSKLFVLTFGMVGLCLGLPVLAFDIFTPPLTRVEQMALDCRLPTIPTRKKGPHPSHRVPSTADPELRLLAHRLQQAAELRGSVSVLFCSLCQGYKTSTLTGGLAECLSARQANVLIINLEEFGRPAKRKRRNGFWGRRKEDEQQNEQITSVKRTLSEALIDGAALPDEVRVDTIASGIDRIELGTGILPPEAFSQPLMERLFLQLRNEYSAILVNGPEAHHLPDVQALAALCDGTLFLASNAGRVPAECRRTVESLVESVTPVLGIAEV